MKLASAHVVVGLLLFVATLARLGLRFRFGKPGPAEGASRLQAIAAGAMQNLLYVVLLAAIATGFVAPIQV